MEHLKGLNKEDKCFLVSYMFWTGSTYRKSWIWSLKQGQVKTVDQLHKNLHRRYWLDFGYIFLYGIKTDSVIISIDPKNLFKLFLDYSIVRNRLYKIDIVHHLTLLKIEV